jgi:putative transposase
MAKALPNCQISEQNSCIYGPVEEHGIVCEPEIPLAVKCLENSLEACLTYLQFPEEEWICLHTTNLIKRLNKEFKRRTKPMEIVAGERSCYTLLTFVCLKMELTWRSKPIGKVLTNLPFLKRLAENNFTQLR